MKLVTAVLQPEMLTQVQIALAKYGIQGMTVIEASGYARQKGHTEVYRGAEFTIDFISKVKIEILATDEDVDGVVKTIAAAARTGQVGDGKIWVLPVEEVIRIRTGDTGADAV